MRPSNSGSSWATRSSRRAATTPSRGSSGSPATGSSYGPTLAVLGTSDDDPPAWLVAGEALEAAFLRATSLGVAMSFLNQVVEDAELRGRIAAASGHDGSPQLVLRFGYGPPQVATARRPVADVLRH